MTVRYFHGGVPGLQVGDFILPPSCTGVVSCSDLAGLPEDEQAAIERVHNRDRVYLTSIMLAGLMFAALAPHGDKDHGGDMYEVVPIGPVEPDPDYLQDDGGSVCVHKAMIVGIGMRSVPREKFLAA